MINQSREIQVREIGWTNQAGSRQRQVQNKENKEILGAEVRQACNELAGYESDKEKATLGEKNPIKSNQTWNWKNILGLMRKKIKAG